MPCRSDLGAAALALARNGRPVFPLRPRAKVPLTEHGCRDATTDPDQVRAWWARWPSANVAIATGGASGLWLLDVDGDEGRASLAALEAAHGPLPDTVRAATGGGGEHLYWRWPAAGPDIRNSAGRIGAGLDVRGEGGSIIAPPSVHPSGRAYRWIAGTLAEAPTWLVALAAPPPPPPRTERRDLPPSYERYVAAAITAELRAVEDAVDGTRNDSLNRAAFNVAQLVGAGAVPETWARDQLEARAVAAGLPAVEARRTINSAFSAGMAHPRELPGATP